MPALNVVDLGEPRAQTPPDEIPEEVSLTVEEVWSAIPGRRSEIEFETVDAAAQWLSDARVYVRHRDPRLVVSGNTASKGKTSGKPCVRFVITEYPVAVAPGTTGTPAAAAGQQ